MKLGNLELENRFLLAPMEAVNCSSFRLLCRMRGASLVFTDMVDTDKFVESLNELHPEEAVRKFINPLKEEKPLAIQLGGSNIINIIKTLNIVENYADVIDFNAGCPLSYVLGKKAGSYLIKHPEQLYKIVKRIRENTKKPLTVKIRSGWDTSSINAIEVSKKLEDIGIDGLIIHPRTRKQGYSSRADWQLVRKIKDILKIPVVLSGDVTNLYLAHMALLHTKVDFIMIGRAAKNNPSIFSKLARIKNMNDFPKKPRTLYDKTKEDAKKDFIEFLELYKKYEHRYSLSEIKDHALWLVRELKNSSLLKKKILNIDSEEEIIRLFKSI